MYAELISFSLGLISGTSLYLVKRFIEKKNTKHFISAYLQMNINRLNSYIEELSASKLKRIPIGELPFDSNLFFNTIAKFRFRNQKELYQIGVSLELIKKAHANFFSNDQLRGGSVIGFITSHYINIYEPYINYFNFDKFEIENKTQSLKKIEQYIKDENKRLREK